MIVTVESTGRPIGRLSGLHRPNGWAGPITIRNDVGGTTELPAGRYRVEVTKTWHDYEIGGRCVGRLVDEADVAKAREVGTTPWTPEHYRDTYPNNPSLYVQAKEAKAAFDPATVYFAANAIVEAP